MTAKPQDDLTAERAAATLLGRMGLVGHPADAQFIGDILEFRRQTRQEALREATVSEAQRHNGLDADPEGAFVYYDEYRALRDERDRLALDLKKRIWLLHGYRLSHLLYGDDGRMDCNVCFRGYAGATLEQCYEWEIADACALVAKQEAP